MQIIVFVVVGIAVNVTSLLHGVILLHGGTEVYYVTVVGWYITSQWQVLNAVQ